MTDRIITTFGRNNKKLLRDYFNNIYGLNVKNIKQIKTVLGAEDTNQSWEYLREKYNDEIINKQKAKKIARYNRAKINKITQNQLKTFTINLRLQIIYHKYPDKQYYEDKVIGPFTRPVKDIESIIKSYNYKESYKTFKVLTSQINYLDIETLKKNRKPKVKQMMKRSFVLKNNWLFYAKSIAKYAFDETDDICVYYQLSKYLLEPPTGRPTKFIEGERTSPDAIFNFLNANVKEDYIEEYPDFKKQSGVSTELIALLCKNTKRSLYAYDEDDKCFYNQLTTNENNHYCPIVYYKLHGHMYLLNSPDAIRSVAEANKPTAKKIITSSIEEDNLKNKLDLSSLNIYHIDEFDIQNAMDLKSGIYLLQKSNIKIHIKL